MPLRDRNSILAPQTNMQIEYGNAIKVERNRKRIVGLFQLNTNPIHYQVGGKVNETASDPLHRKPSYLIAQRRVEDSTMRSRGYYRPAAPQQVNWKYSYWSIQPAHKGPSIGPYNVQQQQSIWSRISNTLSGLTTGGK